MLENPHVKDADKLISFFSDTRKQYESQGGEKSLISFCLQVLNVPTFDMKDIESALSDLNSIIILISRELSGEELERFNRTVKTEVDKIDMWLHGVYNHKISPDNAELLFGDYSDVSYAMSVASKKVLRDDYFDLQTEGTGQFSIGVITGTLDKEESKTTGADYICTYGNGAAFMYNEIPWTERNVIWMGNEKMFNERMNGKYRKVRDKRLIAILKGLYSKIGDALVNAMITVEDGSLQSEDSYQVVCKKNDGIYSVTIKKV